MSIRIFTENDLLRRMLQLELSRQGFVAEGAPSLILLDLDTHPAPEVLDGTPIIAFSEDPDRLAKHADRGYFALCALPLAVTELAENLYRLRTKSQSAGLLFASGSVFFNGSKLALSATEAALLTLLYQNRDRIVTEEELRCLLGESASHTNTVAVYLYRLRKKLGPNAAVCLRSIRGKGCRWIEA